MRSRPRRWRTRLLLLAGSCAAAILAPNTLWLARSTARVDNYTGLTLESFQVQVGSAATPAVDLPARSSRFLVLPDQGDATMSVRFQVGDATHGGCVEYVQGDMYHVAVSVGPGPVLTCEPTLAIFSRLLAIELLRGPGQPPVAARPALFSTRDPLEAFVHQRYPLGSDYFIHGAEDTYLFRCVLEGEPDRPGRVAYSEISIWGNRTGPWELFERQPDGSYRYTETRLLTDTSCLERCASREWLASGSCRWERGWPSRSQPGAGENSQDRPDPQRRSRGSGS